MRLIKKSGNGGKIRTREVITRLPTPKIPLIFIKKVHKLRGIDRKINRSSSSSQSS